MARLAAVVLVAVHYLAVADCFAGADHYLAAVGHYAAVDPSESGLIEQWKWGK